MKINEFNTVYEQAKQTIIVNNNFFICAGWFWINLTEKQHKKMYNLMLSQGAKEEVNDRGQKGIYLGNGMQILAI